MEHIAAAWSPEWDISERWQQGTRASRCMEVLPRKTVRGEPSLVERFGMHLSAPKPRM